MLLYRRGLYRNRGASRLVSKNPEAVHVTWDRGKNVVEFIASNDVQDLGKTSYRYHIRMEAELIIRALMKLPSEEIIRAIHGKDDDDAKTIAGKIGSLAVGIAKKNEMLPLKSDDGLFG